MYEFATDTPVSLELRVAAGRCDLTAEPRDTTTVEVEPLDPGDDRARQAADDTVVQLSGHRLIVKTPDTSGVGWLFGRRTAKLRVAIAVPVGSTLDAKVASADLTGTGELGAASIGNASGDVRLERVTGDVSVNTASGDVRLDHVGGSLKANSASGDVEAARVDGDVSHNSASGDTRIGATYGTVKVHSASGDVRIDAVVSGSVKVNTASGDIHFGVPAGTGVWMDLNTGSGMTSSDLSIGSERPLAGHDVELRGSTASGDIEIHRVPAAS